MDTNAPTYKFVNQFRKHTVWSYSTGSQTVVSDHTISRNLVEIRCILVLPLLQMGVDAGPLGHCTGVVPPLMLPAHGQSRMILRVTLKQCQHQRHHKKITPTILSLYRDKAVSEFRGHNDCENTLQIKRDIQM